MPPKVRLALAALLFLGWMAWLGYAALTKSHGPVVSTAQVAATTHAVVAKVENGTGEKPGQNVQVVESLKGDLPAGSTQFVTNLHEIQGYVGPGDYLLLLTQDPNVAMARDDGAPHHPLTVVGLQRSPGYDLAGPGKPTIYPWTLDVKAQTAKLLK